MNNADIFFLGSWAVSIIASLTFCIITFTLKDGEGFKNSISFLVISITPFGAAIPLIVIMLSLAFTTISGLEALGNLKRFKK